MRTTPTFGFDLRDAVDSIKDAFAPRSTPRSGSERHGHEDVRSAILLELSAEPMHGYQIIQAIETRSGGTWKPSAGAVYPLLQLLADEELVTVQQVGERKVYALTEAGREAAADAINAQQPRDQHEPQRERGAGLTLAKSSAKLAQALGQFTTNGTPEQSKLAVEVVDEARRKLYAILAES